MKILSVITYSLITLFYLTIIGFGVKNRKQLKNVKLSRIFYADWEKDDDDN